jgi:hypothetical protein
MTIFLMPRVQTRDHSSDRQRRCSTCRRSRYGGSTLEIAADEPQDLRRGVAKTGAVARDRPREHVVTNLQIGPL